jgi:hypothetical protein
MLQRVTKRDEDDVPMEHVNVEDGDIDRYAGSLSDEISEVQVVLPAKTPAERQHDLRYNDRAKMWFGDPQKNTNRDFVFFGRDSEPPPAFCPYFDKPKSLV